MSYFDRSKYLLNIQRNGFSNLAQGTQDAQAVNSQEQQANQQGRFGDFIDSMQAGALSATGGMVDFAAGLFDWQGGAEIAQKFYGWSDDQYQQMSQRGRDAMSKSFFDEDENGDLSIGDGLTDIDTWLLTIANVAGQFIPTAVPGAGAAGAVSKVAKLGTTGKNVAGAVGMGATGGAAATGQGGEQAREEVRQMPQAVLDAAPIYQDLVAGIKENAPTITEEEAKNRARKALADQMASEVMRDPESLLANFAASAIGDPVIGRALLGARIAKGALGSAVKGFVTEGSTEAVQAGTQQYGINEALTQIDGRDKMKGVKAAALNEGVAGGGFGAGAGLLGGLINRNQPGIDDNTGPEDDQPAVADSGSVLDAGNAPIVNADPSMNLPPEIQQTINAQPLTGAYADPTATGAMVAPDPVVQKVYETNPDLASQMQQTVDHSAKRSQQIKGLLSQVAKPLAGSYADPSATGAMAPTDTPVNVNINRAPATAALESARKALLDGMVQGAIADQAAGTPSPETVTAPQSAQEAQAMPANNNKVTKVSTPNNSMSVDTEYRVVEADSLITSNDFAGAVNPNYPAELQPRDRSRQSYQVQVNNIAKDPKPELLAESPTSNLGAPVVRNGVVESGNGRSIGLREAYRTGKADKYKQSIIDRAQSLGLDPEQVANMRQPVLVRERVTELDAAGVRKFTQDSNRSTGVEQSPVERAKADAELLDDALMSKLSLEDGDFLSDRNRAFVSDFVSRLGSNEAGAYLTADGKWNRALSERVRNAVFAKGFDNMDLLSEISENPDPDSKNLLNAMMNVSGKIGATRAYDAETGKYTADAITRAAQMLMDAKRNGTIVSQVSAQGDMVSGTADDYIVALAQALESNYKSAKKMSVLLDDIASQMLTGASKSGEVDLFTGEPAGTPDIKEAINNVTKPQATTGSNTTGSQSSIDGTADREANTTERPSFQQDAEPRESESTTSELDQTPASAGVSVSEPVKWFGSREKADAWVAKQKDPASYRIEQSGKSRFEIYQDGQQSEAGSNLIAKKGDTFTTPKGIKVTVNQDVTENDSRVSITRTLTTGKEITNELSLEDFKKYRRGESPVESKPIPTTDDIERMAAEMSALTDSERKAWRDITGMIRNANAEPQGSENRRAKTERARREIYKAGFPATIANDLLGRLDPGYSDSSSQPEKQKLENATAPEHVTTGVDDRELDEIVQAFNDAQEAERADGSVTRIFDHPKKDEIVRLADKVKVFNKQHGWMTPAEAKAKIAEWKANAEAQYDDYATRSQNSQRVVLSLFDKSGQWSQPWEDAGYQVYRFDIQNDPDMGDVNNFSTEFFSDWFGDFDGMDVYAILAACPCTDFASSGARHFAAKDADGRTIASVKLVQQTLATIEYFKPAVWAIENPVGRIEKLGGLPNWRLSFDPNHIGEPYTKKTLLWGRFNADLPIAPVEPTEGSKMHSKYGGKSLATKNARSVTPEGFAYAFFQSNNAIDNPVMAVANKFDRLDADLIKQAMDAGVTEQQITEAVEDYYYMDLDDDAANNAIRELIPENAKGEVLTSGALFSDESFKFNGKVFTVTKVKGDGSIRAKHYLPGGKEQTIDISKADLEKAGFRVGDGNDFVFGRDQGQKVEADPLNMNQSLREQFDSMILTREDLQAARDKWNDKTPEKLEAYLRNQWNFYRYGHDSFNDFEWSLPQAAKDEALARVRENDNIFPPLSTIENRITGERYLKIAEQVKREYEEAQQQKSQESVYASLTDDQRSKWRQLQKKVDNALRENEGSENRRIKTNFSLKAIESADLPEQIKQDLRERLGATEIIAKPVESKLDKAADAISAQKKAAALKLKKLFDERKGQLNSGVDPEVLLAVAEVGALSIAEGAVKFAQWVRDVLNTTRAVGIADDDVKPFLKEAYGAMYANPEKYGIDDATADLMDNPRDTRKTDIDSLLDAEQPAEADAPSSETELANLFLDGFSAMDRADFRGVKNNTELRKLAGEMLGVPAREVSNIQIKAAQEAYETVAIVDRRSTIRKAFMNDGAKQAVMQAVKLYEAQPNLDMRSANSSDMQAYSTPAPMATIANIAAGVNSKTRLYEPTAGNGLLMMFNDPQNTFANELDPVRANSLAWTGFNVTVMNGAMNPISSGIVDGEVDVVLANPPFGKLRDDAGNPTRFDFNDYRGMAHSFGELDHVIAAESLSAMKDDGKAVLILGAPKEAGDYRGNNKAFLNWLYSNYNVVHHVEVDGDLYKRQGAAWPTQMIVVYGRERQGTGKFAPLPGEVKRYSTWSSLYDSFDKSGLMGAKGSVTSKQFSNGSVLSTPYGKGNEGISSRADFEPVGKRTAGNGQSRPSGSGRSGRATGVVNTGRNSAEPDGAFNSQPDISQSGLVNSEAEPDSKPASSGSARGSERVGLPSKRDGQLTPVVKVNEFQARYDTRSGGLNDNVLTPVNIATYTQQALLAIDNAHPGGVDGYVMDKLGYKNTKSLHDAFMGLQVDAIALAVNAIETGRAVVIGDQTGVGKGRQAAGIIRYAIQQGKVPVFVSQKPNLFTDMFDDLHDIGMKGVRPLIMNNGEGITKGDEKLFNLPNTERKALLTKLAESGKMPEGYDYLSLTYSQISSDNNGFKTGVLGSIADNAIFILDESHTAAGQESKLGKAFQGFVQRAAGVTYLSATYAKRPDNMLLYVRTDLGLAMETHQELIDVVNAGGIGMQAYIAGKLAEAGQMIRRERSFDGISIDNVFLEDASGKIKQQFDAATTALRAIQSLSAAWKYYVDTYIKEQMQRTGGFDTAVAGNKADTTINVTLFSSVVHNYIAQLTLALKANKIAEVAVNRHKAGERPVIALENTMGSALRDYMEQTGLSVGDSAADLDFGKLLTSIADRVLAYSIKQPGQKESTRVLVPISKVADPLVQKLYKEVRRLSTELSRYAIPASPIDIIRSEVEKAGLSVSEVTGREYVVDYADGAKIKNKSNREKNNRRGVVDDFNRGKVDVLILNQAGSTGLSIHASEKFKDQKPRHMIVAQPSLDINTFMQMLGRVNRTGQVVKPSYSLAWLSLPSEKRPAAVLSGKMRKLNANTSGNDKSATSIESIDLLNDYGNKVVKEYVIENMTELKEFNDRLVDLPDGDEAVYFLGKLAVLPVDIQEKVYSDIETNYADLINFLNATGQNELSTDFVDLDAKPIAQKVVSEYKLGRGVFSEPAYLTQVDVKATGKAPTWAEVQEALEKTSQNDFDAVIDAATSDDSFEQALAKRIEEVKEQREQARIDGKKTDSFDADLVKLENKLQENSSDKIEIASILRKGGQYSHGSRIKVKLDGAENTVVGVVVGIDYKHKVGTGNPLAPSKFTFKVMLADRARTVPVKLSQAKNGLVEGIAYGATSDIAAIFDREASLPQREERFIMTGNLLAAQSRSHDKGRIIPFTTNDGRIIQGMLMPRKFKPETSIKQEISATLDQLIKWIKGTDDSLAALGLITRNGDVALYRDLHNRRWFISLPRAASRGKQYWGNPKVEAIIGKQAFKGGGSASVRVIESDLDALAKAINDINPLTITNDAQISDFKRSAGIPEPDFSTQDIKFSKKALLKRKPQRGVPFAVAKREAERFVKRLNGAAGINVVVFETQAEAEEAWRMSMDGDYVRGAYSDKTRTAYIIAENQRDLTDLRQTLAHEIIAHGGLDNVVGAATAKRFLDRVKETRNKRDFKQVWAEIDRNYDGMSEDVKAEELFAYFVQNEPERGSIKYWWQALVRWLNNQLAKIGLAKGDSLDSQLMRDMMTAIVDGFIHKRQAEIGLRANGSRYSKQSDSQITSPAFKKWFGNSKVVDSNGKPAVVYHGTTANEISQFSTSGFFNSSNLGNGAYFTSEVADANNYATDDTYYNLDFGPKADILARETGLTYQEAKEYLAQNKGTVYPVYLKIERPLVIGDKPLRMTEAAFKYDIQDLIDPYYLEGRGFNKLWEKFSNASSAVEQYEILANYRATQAFKQFALSGNHDGIIVMPSAAAKGKGATHYVVFDSKQVKSAIGNNGEFDPGNPDIRFSRINLSFKEATKRIPEIQQAAAKLKAKEITGREYDSVVDNFKPVEAYQFVPEPASYDDIQRAIASNKRDLIGKPSSTLADGHKVGLRVDIPAYTNHGVWVVSVHEGKASGAGGAAGKVIGYESTASVTNPKFGVAENSALKIALGEAKGTIATIGGEWVSSTPEEIAAQAQKALNNPNWAQVGMDPERHSYFYDRATMEPIVSGDSALQVGGLVLVENPVYGNKDDFLFSKTRKPDTRTAREKIGQGEVANNSIRDLISNTMQKIKDSDWWQSVGSRAREGIFDGLHGIKKAEEAAGVTDPNKQGYVSARLATGLGDMLHALFSQGALEWRGGVTQVKPNTKGLLEIFGMLPEGTGLNDWLAWMAANRAEKLMAEGRENNLTEQDIAELKALAKGNEALFERVRKEYNKINSATLDLAQQAGLISAEQRAGFDEEWYVPFFREMEVEDPDLTDVIKAIKAPFTTKTGIVGQSANIKALLGGTQSTQDLLQNIIQRQVSMIDAAIKNKAALEVAGNLDGTGYMTREDSPDFGAAVEALGITRQELAKRHQKVRIMENGQPVYYYVHDAALLRGLMQVHDVGSKALFNKMARSAKRFLTTGVTLSPDFIIRNFIRDAAHAWMVNKDGAKLGVDSWQGLKASWNEDPDYWKLIASGAAFQGGYIHGADPEAAQQQIRRALRAKGMTADQVNRHMATIVTGKDKLMQVFEKYRQASDKIENANRMAVYRRAIEAGKSEKQALYESKDLMDYSLKGNFEMMQTLIDMLPFFNARLQGLYKLGRAAAADGNDQLFKVLSRDLAMKGLKVAAFSLALAAMYGDDERYKELAEWDKDAHWHFFLGDQHWRIPKPFELGIVFGTFPERLFNFAAGNQSARDARESVANAVFNTLALNPIPQVVMPVYEVLRNKSSFTGAQIETLADQQRMKADRYNERTSDVARALGDATALVGLSPKQVEHLITGYTGTLGAYVLGMADYVARAMTGREKADLPVAEWPIIKTVYQSGKAQRNTLYQQRFIESLEKAREAYGSIKLAMDEQDPDRARKLFEDKAKQMQARLPLERVQRQVTKINQAMRAVERSIQLSGSEKKEKLQQLQRQKNALYEAAYLKLNLSDW